ncbi:FAD-dependent oxidoreductase [Actinoplanes sp. NPDC051851]|uniref:FAD-dependent oxidoreductase n=1 Tax=Actinoplanes sp. NPDC051851 TaxID=3154753 RepID=UPI00341E6629
MTDVLVVGAGPTGLTLAVDLARRGAAVRIIDRGPTFPTGSRGKGLSPRSLEVLDDLGVADRISASGVTHLPHRKYQGTEVTAEVDPEAGIVPTPGVPYPTTVLIPQWRVEQILRDRLAEFGVTVELGTELRAFHQHADGVTATISGADGSAGADTPAVGAGGTADGAVRSSTPGGMIRDGAVRDSTADDMVRDGTGRDSTAGGAVRDSTIEARYLVGCDGGRSTVRRALGLAMRGETPDVQLMAVGDVEVEGLSRDVWHQWFAGGEAMMLCPLPGTRSFQVQASHELDAEGVPLAPTLERFQRTFDRVTGVPGVRLHNLTWRSTYRVNVRMVDRLRSDRVFLAGDAAHIHPIAGGLGMNIGIQDAYNLGWKLGLVLAGRASDALLDTYEEERLPIASRLLDITSERLAVVLDAVKQRGGGIDAVATPELTQLAVNYPWSRLSRDRTAKSTAIRPGNRAPDASGRLFDLFRGPHFTLLHVPAKAARTPGVEQATTGSRLEVEQATTASGLEKAATASGAAQTTSTPTVKEAVTVSGLAVVHSHVVEPDGHVTAAYGTGVQVLVRPDGYVAMVAEDTDKSAVDDYLGAL